MACPSLPTCAPPAPGHPSQESLRPEALQAPHCHWIAGNPGLLQTRLEETMGLWWLALPLPQTAPAHQCQSIFSQQAATQGYSTWWGHRAGQGRGERGGGCGSEETAPPPQAPAELGEGRENGSPGPGGQRAKGPPGNWK